MLRKSVAGRPALPLSTVEQIQQHVSDGYSLRSIAEHMQLSLQTVVKYKKLMDENSD